MARAVYRYRHNISDPDEIVIKNCCRIVHAEAVGDDVVDIWAVVEVGNSLGFVHKQIEVVGTGMEYGAEWSYEATTARTPAGLIWHVISKIT